MKKVISLLLAVVMLCSFVTFGVAASQFPDVPQGHWAEPYITALVNSGTVSGFEDGTFQPEGVVLREQFVKMIGMGPTRATTDFADVSPNHWGYEYIMTSGLAADGNNCFRPEEAITRGDVALLLWQRAGSKTGIAAPGVITSQHPNRDAAAWVYQYGIMIGDDGLNLRMEDSLTRAEAAALIVRSQQLEEDAPQVNFIDTVSPELLETVFESVPLFDNPSYSPDRVFTNGEIARAALRLGAEEFNLTYQNQNSSVPFEHQYARDLQVMGDYCLGTDKINAQYIDQNATVQDALISLTYNLLRKTHSGLLYGNKGNYYPDAAQPGTDMANVCLTFAKENGVELYAGGRLNAAGAVTGKELAAILLQLDELAGLETDTSSDVIGEVGAVKYADHSLLKDLNQYPQNAELYQCVLKGIPREVYTKPFLNMVDAPREMYNLTREFGYLQSEMLTLRKNRVQREHGVTVRFTYYPSLVCNNGNGFTMRVKCEFLSVPGEMKFADVFPCGTGIDGAQAIYTGLECYVDVSTGSEVTGIHMDDDTILFEQIVCVVK